MTELTLWEIYVRKNPSFEEKDVIKITQKSLRKLVAETYRIAHDQGFKNGRAFEKTDTERKNAKKQYQNPFEGLF